MIGHRIGYQRVSTIDQNPERQLEGLGVDRMFTDRCSGKTLNRPELDLCVAFLRDGDTLLVHSIDRLARNLDDLRAVVSGLVARGVRVEFVKEALTFTSEPSPVNTLMLSMMGAFAEFERALMRERQREGIALAHRRGVYRGKKRKLSAERVAELCRRVAVGDRTKVAIAREFGIHPTTLYDYLKRGGS